MSKKVEVEITIRGLITVPDDWDSDLITFHMNEASNCIDNQLDEIKNDHTCFCSVATGKVIHE